MIPALILDASTEVLGNDPDAISYSSSIVDIHVVYHFTDGGS